MSTYNPKLTEFLPLKGVATLLSVCPKTVKRMVQRGELTKHRLSPTCVRYARQEVLDLMEKSKVAA